MPVDTGTPTYNHSTTPFPKYDPSTDYLPTWLDLLEDHLDALHITETQKKWQHCLLLLGNLAEVVRPDISKLDT